MIGSIEKKERKGYGSKSLHPNLGYYPGISLEGLRKITTKKLQLGQPISRLAFEPKTS
jgi:hypothetical protein